MSARSRVAAVHPLTWVVTAVVVAGLIAWPLGGWDTVSPSSQTIPKLASGQTHRSEEFATRIVSATVGTGSPRTYDTVKPGTTFLIVTIDVENLTDDTLSSIQLDDLIRVPGVVGVPNELLASDLTSGPELVPGLRMRVLLTWMVPVREFAAGTRVTIQLVDRSPYDSVLSTGIGWHEPRVTAVADVVLAQGATAAPEDSSDPFGSTDGSAP